MSNTDDAKPLDPAEVVPEEFEDEDLYGGTNDDGLGPADEDENEPGLPTSTGEKQPAQPAHDDEAGMRS